MIATHQSISLSATEHMHTRSFHCDMKIKGFEINQFTNIVKSKAPTYFVTLWNVYST